MKEKPRKILSRGAAVSGKEALPSLGLLWFDSSFCVSVTHMAAVRKHVPVEYQVK